MNIVNIYLQFMKIVHQYYEEKTVPFEVFTTAVNAVNQDPGVAMSALTRGYRDGLRSINLLGPLSWGSLHTLVHMYMEPPGSLFLWAVTLRMKHESERNS